MLIVRDKNNFPIEPGDIVVIYTVNKQHFGSLGIIKRIDFILNHDPAIIILIDEKEGFPSLDIVSSSNEIEVIDSEERNIFNGFNTSVSIPWHTAKMIKVGPRSYAWKDIEKDKKFLKKFEERYGGLPGKRMFPVISINWSERGRGFGEYLFWQEPNGKIVCNNEGDSKESIKRVLCALVDKAELQD